jgi:hypothetical protein
LLVYFLGVVLALINLRRCAVPALLCLLGCGLLLLTSFVTTGIQAVIIPQQADGTLQPGQFVQLMSLVGVAGSIARAAGIGLLVAAVFVGRNNAMSGTA